jgi:hypothetical protein
VDPVERKLRSDVEQFGWHVVNVLPEADHSPHSYSVGLFATYAHSEIVVVGLSGGRAHTFINNIGDEIRDGASFEAGCRYDHLINGYDVAFVRVRHDVYANYFGRAIDYYGGVSFPVLQMVWPDRTGHFPWQAQCEAEIRQLQPVLAPQSTSG